MHYKDGTEAKVGDYARGKDWQGKTIIGRVMSVTPGSTSCNLTIAHTVQVPMATTSSVTAGDYELVHRDEAEQAPA